MSESSASSNACPKCGVALLSSATAGLCPRCLMAEAMAPTQPDAEAAEARKTLAPEELAPHFPQLEILECLGRGGMGVVYKARQRSLNRFVALKLLAPERVGDGKFAERFTREAQALAALNHPNIVTIHDFGQAGGFYFLLMEFVDGANLRQLLRARKFTPEEALAIVPPLCDALQFAHNRGIVHRDIKPENLLLDKDGRVKVADFGIAKMLGEPNGGANAGEPVAPENATQTTLGTPGYSAPEQKTDPQRVDSRADIYSLGVVFYEMLTGELPGKRLEAPSRKVQIDARLDEVVLRALEKNPDLRYQQVSEVKTMVETIVGTSANKDESAVRACRATEGVDYRSKATLFGLPLLHVTSGIDPQTGRARVAKGIIAIGGRAQGVIAFGGVATGGFAFGGVAIGVFAFGGFGLGLIAFGGVAVALLAALGGGAIAPIAIGGEAMGFLACGGQAIGAHVLDAATQDPAARQFFLSWAKMLMANMPWFLGILIALVFGIGLGVPLWLWNRGQFQTASPASPLACGLTAKMEGACLAPAEPGGTCGSFTPGGISPWTSPEMREIYAHMTEAEKARLKMFGAAFGTWNAATFFLPLACIWFFPIPVPANWIIASVVMLASLAFYPLWWRRCADILCGTAWAKGRDCKPEAIRIFPLGMTGMLLMSVVMLLILSVLWWGTYKPEGVWLPSLSQNSIPEQDGEMLFRVTEVSQRKQIVLVRIACEPALAKYQVLATDTGPGFDLPDGITNGLPRVDCLVAPDSRHSVGKTMAGSNGFSGEPDYLIGFVLPDERAAARAVEEVRRFYLAKPTGLTKPHNSLPLFALRRGLGKDAGGKPVYEDIFGSFMLDAKTATQVPPPASFASPKRAARNQVAEMHMMGYPAFGGQAMGARVLDPSPQDPAARQLILSWAKTHMANMQWFGAIFIMVVIGIIVGVPLWVRRRMAEGDKRHPENRKLEIVSRFSRPAIVGVGFGTLGMVALVLYAAIGDSNLLDEGPSDLLEAFWLLCLLVSTILGWVAVAQIRRPAENLRGMWLAVFDGLLFPLLALNGLLVYLAAILVDTFSSVDAVFTVLVQNGAPPGSSERFEWQAGIATVIVCTVANTLIGWGVWRAVNKRRPNSPAVGVEEDTFGKWACGPLVAGTIGPSMVLTVGPWQEGLPGGVLGALCSVALALPLFWGLKRWRERKGKLVVIVLSAACVALIVEAAVLSFVDVPAKQARIQAAFGPVTECTLPMDENGWTPLFDLDHNQTVPDPKPGDSMVNTFNMAQHLGQLKTPGVAIHYDGQTHVTAVSGMVIRYGVGEGDQWEKLVDMDSLAGLGGIGFLSQPLLTIPGSYQTCDFPNTLPFTIHFKTALTKLGLLQITGFTENPRGVKIRYKLITKNGKQGQGMERVVIRPPFVAQAGDAAMELVGLAPEASTNALCWYPDGSMTSERFPDDGGSFGARSGMEIVKLAFRVHVKPSVTDLTINFIHEPESWTHWAPFPRRDMKSPVATFSDRLELPAGTSQLNIEVGVADGPWEKAVELSSGVPGMEEGSFSATAPDGTKWIAAVQLVPRQQEKPVAMLSKTNASGPMTPQTSQSNRNEVRLSFQYSAKKDWETRLVGCDTHLGLIPLTVVRDMDLWGAGLKSTLVSVPLDEYARIWDFQLQRRKYQWVEFRNVSLQPGHMTTVEITDSGAITSPNRRPLKMIPPPASFESPKHSP